MTDVLTHISEDPLSEDRGSTLRDWAEDVLDLATTFAQGALDVAGVALIAGLIWQALPDQPKAPAPVLPGEVVATCVADCIATSVLDDAALSVTAVARPVGTISGS